MDFAKVTVLACTHSDFTMDGTHLRLWKEIFSTVRDLFGAEIIESYATTITRDNAREVGMVYPVHLIWMYVYFPFSNETWLCENMENRGAGMKFIAPGKYTVRELHDMSAHNSIISDAMEYASYSDITLKEGWRYYNA